VFVRITNLQRSSIYLDRADIRYVSLPANSKEGLRTRLSRNDILVSITADLGIIGYIPAEPEVPHYINQHIALVRPNPRSVCAHFLAYQLASPRLRNTINQLNDAGAKAGLSLPTIRSIPVLLPPLCEQEKIAEILSTWDKAIATTEKLLANAEAQKRALMQKLLTGKRRLKGYVRDWEEVPIGAMGQVVGGGTPETVNPDYWEGGIPWATPTDITRLRSRFIGETARTLSASGLKNCAAKPLPPGTLLVCTRATVGELAIASVEITTNQGFKSLVPTQEHDVEFLYYLIAYHKHRLVRLACGSTFLELSKRDFERCSFKVPRRDEQAAIAAVLNAASDHVERFRDQGAILATEKRALMQQLLTGKRRVTS
jgi:type I restriction enzyme S subunit